MSVFYEKIKDQVTDLTPQYAYPNDGTSFGHFIIRECFHKIVDFDFDGQDFDDYIKNHIVDGAHDNGNDGIFVNKKRKQILVFQFKYSQNSNLLNTTEIRKNKKFLDAILHVSDEALTPNPRLRSILDNEIAEVITPETLENGQYLISFYYIDRSFPQSNRTDINALFNNYRDRNINFEVKYYDYEALNDLYDDIEIPKNKVNLAVVPGEHFIKTFPYYDTAVTELQTIVCSIRANSLKELVHEQNEMLFALNVRYFKGENDINSKIKQEYSKGSRSNFWILNNGINAVCEDFALDTTTLEITNFQIVNGGQTTKTLTTLINDLPDEVNILMRLTKIADATKISRISKEIATSSNNQNAITQRDLHSGDRLQATIFKKLENANIFYDKKDGEWAATSNKIKYRNPHGRSPLYLKISNTDLGKAYLSFFLQIPISTKGRDKMVFSEDYYSDIFNQEVNEDQQFLKLMLAHRIAEKVNERKGELEGRFEILQSSYINDVLLSLTALYFIQDQINVMREPQDIKQRIDILNCQPYLNSVANYELVMPVDFDGFIEKLIRGLQNTLDVLKAAKELNGEQWLQRDTNNWLKKDGTYKQIIGRVVTYLRQNP
jgi:hypothetical protein